MICLLALISSVLMIVFRKCFANFITWSCGVDKNRAAVVLKIYASAYPEMPHTLEDIHKKIPN